MWVRDLGVAKEVNIAIAEYVAPGTYHVSLRPLFSIFLYFFAITLLVMNTVFLLPAREIFMLLVSIYAIK